MADKKLIDNSSATTVDNFYGNKSGADVQIPLATAASVLAATMGNPMTTIGGVYSGDNVDNLTDTGIYRLYGGGASILEATPYGLLLVFKNGNWTIQIFIHLELAIMVRSYNGTNWRNWIQISTL